MPKMVIFDFDGTIADSQDRVIAEYNRIAPRFRVKAIDPSDLPRLRTLTGPVAMREHGVTFWKLPFIVSAMRSALREHSAAVEPHRGMPEALRALAASGYRLSVLSTNSSENIERFLARHELSVFEHVAGGASMFGTARALNKLVQRLKLDPAQAFYVGDEIRDVEAAAKAGIPSIAVSWGYADRSALARHAPTHLAEQPSDLLRFVHA